MSEKYVNTGVKAATQTAQRQSDGGDPCSVLLQRKSDKIPMWRPAPASNSDMGTHIQARIRNIMKQHPRAASARSLLQQQDDRSIKHPLPSQGLCTMGFAPHTSHPGGADGPVSTNISCPTAPGHHLSDPGPNIYTAEEHRTAPLGRLHLHNVKAFYSLVVKASSCLHLCREF